METMVFLLVVVVIVAFDPSTFSRTRHHMIQNLGVV